MACFPAVTSPSLVLQSLLTIYRPQNAKELFNLRHSSLRNAIERCFGVLKRRFRILRTAPEYPMKIQVNLLYRLTAIHNYIRLHGGLEDLERGLDPEEEAIEEAPLELERRTNSTMDIQRDEIARRMWEDYTRYNNI